MESSAEFGSSSLSLKAGAQLLLLKLREKVSQVYYKHGLICSRHPWILIFSTLVIVSFCSYPILGIHFLHNNHHQQYVTNLKDLPNFSQNAAFNSFTVSSNSGDSEKQEPRWYQNAAPFAFVQQIIVKSAVIPWKSNLILVDAIRAPLAEVFPLVEFLSNHRFETSKQHSISLNDLCFQVSEPVLIHDNVASSYLPRFSCLVVSPANVWKNDINKYLQDATIINTLYTIKHIASSDTGSLREILFGEPWTETGIKLIFSEYNREFVDNLKHTLRERYSLDPFKGQNESDLDKESEALIKERENEVTHLHFQDQFSMVHYLPLMAVYAMLFIYVYFSVRKIDLIKYKLALALGSVLTVVLSLLMTVGICLWFDFNPTLSGSDILPYLVVVIGLENMLVLTKSVVSTPAHLDIKIRVAQGLSREGPSFTKNLILELTLLIFGFFTFVPIIQEFCLFGMIGFLSDFFLQLTFFATILSVDIQRIELNNARKLQTKLEQIKKCGKVFEAKKTSQPVNIAPTTIFARPSRPIHFKLPKRLRFVYFWARTRIVHRVLMICLMGWIGMLIFRSGLIDQFYLSQAPNSQMNAPVSQETESSLFHLKNDKDNSNQEKENQLISDTSMKRLLHQAEKPWNLLSTQHWSTLFGYYNISLSGRYISILPPLHLSIPVDPSAAMRLRHPSESDPQIFRQFLSPGGIHSLLDPNDDVDDFGFSPKAEALRKHWTSSEILFAFILSIPTLIFIIYVFVTLYRCMCSRNYAEWRSSWSESLKLKNLTKRDVETVITETVPLILAGHEQEIEYISASEVTPFVVSCCMQGDIRVWDVLSGECHTLIKRYPVSSTWKENFKPHHKASGSFSSDSTYGSSPGNNSLELEYATNGRDAALTAHRSSIDSPVILHSNDNGYNFGLFTKLKTSPNIIKDLILSAAANDENNQHEEMSANVSKESYLSHQSIWCVDIYDRFVFIGCKNGRFEVWDALTGNLLYHNEANGSGVTVIRANGTKVIVGYLSGVFDIYERENINGFHSSITPYDVDYISVKGEKMYTLLQSIRAHLQPITALKLEASHIVTGSADHLLKVYKLDTGACLYTLHSHCGGITTIEIDNSTPTSALSGCQVGQVCVWDLMTGTCVFSLEAHQGAAVLSLLATPLYFISCGTDNRICIWDKYSGHLVHTINQHHSLCSDMILLTSNILVTAKEDHLILYDISEASAIRIVNFNHSGDSKSYIKNLRISSRSRAVVCEFGKLLCIVHFPGVTQKND
ncbi:Sterol regulatory element-binding protein cleavage-activating protein-like protein [Dinothrombium tinctorium]|uniref:Sterol regulatory element-binding protein cleavage-activating protein n=1 Tax=Dinothrombium tinctorium TaxID=1965070 RepID=A0A443RM38_9ACAR|nr:Sterol regulatory element-binding protein cleavage-activating protein-like protein [Dinothrombium tinctorium]